MNQGQPFQIIGWDNKNLAKYPTPHENSVPQLKNIVWLLESETEVVATHGGRVLKQIGVFSDFFGPFTSVSAGYEAAVGFSHQFDVQYESSLHIQLQIKAHAVPYEESDLEIKNRLACRTHHSQPMATTDQLTPAWLEYKDPNDPKANPLKTVILTTKESRYFPDDAQALKNNLAFWVRQIENKRDWKINRQQP